MLRRRLWIGSSLLGILFSALLFQNCSRQPFEVINQTDLSKSDVVGSSSPGEQANIIILNSPKAFESKNQISISFSLEPTNGLGGDKSFRCQFDAQNWEACESPVTISKIKDGAHTLSIKAIDVTTGQESFPKEIVWVVDTQRPTIILNQTPPSLTAATAAIFLFSSIDILSGIQKTECSLDASEWKECVSPLMIEHLNPGNHKLHLRTTDMANIPSLETIVEWKIDPTSQSIEFISAPPSYQSARQATFEFSLAPKSSASVTFECRLSTENQFSSCSNAKHIAIWLMEITCFQFEQSQIRV